jgi:hypothetical protein
MAARASSRRRRRGSRSLFLYATGLHLTGLGSPHERADDDVRVVAGALRRSGGAPATHQVSEELLRTRDLDAAVDALRDITRPHGGEVQARVNGAPIRSSLEYAFEGCLFYEQDLAAAWIERRTDDLRDLIARAPLPMHHRGMLATFPVVELLEPLLAYEERNARVTALRVLESAADPRPAPLLQRVLERDPDPLARATARRALSRLWPRVSVPVEKPGTKIVIELRDRTRVTLGAEQNTLSLGGPEGCDVPLQDGGLFSAVLENVDGRAVLWAVEGTVTRRREGDEPLAPSDWVILGDGVFADVAGAFIDRNDDGVVRIR